MAALPFKSSCRAEEAPFLRDRQPRLAQAVSDVLCILGPPEGCCPSERSGGNEMRIKPTDLSGLRARIFKLPQMSIGGGQPGAARSVIGRLRDEFTEGRDRLGIPFEKEVREP